VPDAGPLGGVDEAEIHDDEIQGAAGEFEDAQQRFEREGLALRGAQSYVQRAGENVYVRFVAGEEAGEYGSVETINAFKGAEEREARLEL
jgi:hypothetical protein